jgi:predicted nucleic acid-binding protein
LTSFSAIDTGVLIEFIDELGDFHSQADAVVDSITKGNISAIITHPTFAELYYVSCRIFEEVEEANDIRKNEVSPESRSADLIRWLYTAPNIIVPQNTVELAIEAGKIKKDFSFALPDSYVMAAAKLGRCQAIFKGREAEMKQSDKIAKLKKDHRIELVFLEDFE